MTKDDFETLDNYTRWRRDKLDAEDNQLERRRMKTISWTGFFRPTMTRSIAR